MVQYPKYWCYFGNLSFAMCWKADLWTVTYPNLYSFTVIDILNEYNLTIIRETY